MSIAWSVTEVIRYSWYALKEATGFAPFPLTWCRYVPSIQHFSVSPQSDVKSNVLFPPSTVVWKMMPVAHWSRFMCMLCLNLL